MNTTTLLHQTQAALERLGELDGWLTRPFVSDGTDDWIPAGEQARRALDAIRAYLAQPQPEPVAWAMCRPDGLVLDVITPEEHESHEGEYTMPLYAAQPAPAEPDVELPGMWESADLSGGFADMSSAQPAPVPVAWVDPRNIASAKVSQDRGGPFDAHVWSEGKTVIHTMLLYSAAPVPVPPGWMPIETAPKDEAVLIYLNAIDAVDIAHKRSDTGKWVSGSGTNWPTGISTHWMPLPPPPGIAASPEVPKPISPHDDAVNDWRLHSPEQKP